MRSLNLCHLLHKMCLLNCDFVLPCVVKDLDADFERLVCSELGDDLDDEEDEAR